MSPGLRCCKLQRLPAEAPPTFVTLNPPKPPAPHKTIQQLQMAHPVASCASYDAQQKLHTVQVTPTDCHLPPMTPHSIHTCGMYISEDMFDCT